MVNDYIIGVCWVMNYYYEGCVSWSWYYPYQYAPFTSDFKGFSKLKVNFTLGKISIWIETYFIYTVNFPFHDYRCCPKNPWNRVSCEYMSHGLLVIEILTHELGRIRDSRCVKWIINRVYTSYRIILFEELYRLIKIKITDIKYRIKKILY